MDVPARSSAPPTSAALCPGCGKPVDALRAGHVAILDGGFRYFHDASCKAAYVDTASKRSSLEAMTAEPPGVRSGVRTAEPPIVISGLPPPAAPASEAPAFPAPRDPTPEPPPEVSVQTARVAPVTEETPEAEEPSPPADADPPSPATLRSSDVDRATPPPSSRVAKEANAPSAPAAEPRAVAKARETAPPALARVLAVAPGVGIAAGLLAVAVALAGEGALAARVPLALAAGLVAVALAAAPRATSSVAPVPTLVERLLAAAPIAATVVATLVVRSLAPARVDLFAVFLGLASAAELAATLVLARARRDVDASRAAVAKALAVSAKVVRGDAVETVPAAQVKSGDVVVVEPDAIVPVDGVVVAGRAEVAPWLDAPVVVEKKEGDPVVAGAMVTSGSGAGLRVTATFTGAERAWLRLSSPSPSDVERAAPMIALAARVLPPATAGAAALSAAAVYASNASWPDVLLTACAGGTVLAARAAIAAVALAHARGHVAAQRRGIAFKDASAFDVASRADIAVVCSRGTVLLGEPEIVAVESVGPGGPNAGAAESARVLALASGAELGSTHPFAAAVLRAARARDVKPESVRSAIGHSGLGVTALVAGGDRVVVGSRAFLLQEKISVAVADARISELEAEGRSVLLVALAEKLVGLLALQDGLRPGARAAVQRLHDADIEPVLLSGEARETCESLARSLEIDHVRPEVLPAERGAEVRALADGGHVVATLGHPASDDGALGAADVAVAMRAAGAAPGEWGVSLASDDVRDAALALAVPRACRERSRTALAVGASAQALATLAVAFGVMPAASIPVLGACVVVVVAALVRDVTPGSRG